MSGGLLAVLLLAAALPSREAGPGDECRAKFSITQVLRESAGPSGRAVEDAMRWELLAYYKWLAFAQSDPEACAPLNALGFKIMTATSSVKGDALCRDLFHRLSFAHGFVARSVDLPDLCLQDVMSINTSKTPDAQQMRKYREACAIIVRTDLPVEKLCPRAMALLPFPPAMYAKQLRRCVCDFTSMNGRGRCHDDPSNDPGGFIGPYRYDSFNALHKALEAKNPELCGTLELCRGLAGQGLAMAELHAKKAADIRCGSTP